jgi:glycosyltransferase involved in cell wall biosynthesis
VNFLRKAKWVLHWLQILIFFLLGRAIRVLPRQKRSLVLMGDVNYTGGTFVYFVALVKALTAQGFRLSVLMPRRYYRSPLGKLAQQEGFRLFVIPDRFVFVEHLLSLWKVGILRASRVVVSASGPGTHTMALLWSIPSVHIIHSVAGRGIEARSRRLISAFLREPHRMVAVSKIARDSMRRYYRIPPQRQHLVSTIYNGVPDSLPARAPEDLEQAVIATAGHVAGYKNPSTWLQTAEYVIARAKNKPRFIWAGEGPELSEYRKKVEGRDQIQFVGYMNGIEALLGRATVYFQPSRLESFGLSVAQAMSMGIPCVVSDRGGLPELVQDGKNGFVCGSDDFVRQGEAILQLLENLQLRTSMSSEARRLYLENFTFDRWGREILSVVRGTAKVGAAN